MQIGLYHPYSVGEIIQLRNPTRGAPCRVRVNRSYEIFTELMQLSNRSYIICTPSGHTLNQSRNLSEGITHLENHTYLKICLSDKLLPINTSC